MVRQGEARFLLNTGDKMKLPITIDFETEAIGDRPDNYPPPPVGVAIQEPGKSPKYLAWGHPTENNSCYETAAYVLRCLWKSGRDLLFHNAPFDLEVANEWFDLPYPPWHKVHDTQLLAFLDNPHSKALGLKPLADTLLNMPPDEQTELQDWILVNVPEAKRAKTQWGKYICKAPGKLVGRYAKGDVVRTRKLFDLFMTGTPKEAYNRERELQPYLLQATIRGVPIAKRKLKKDLKVYEKALIDVDSSIRKQLQEPDLDIDSPKQLAEALDKRGLVDEWVSTPKGGRSVSAQALAGSCSDQRLVELMRYRGRLKTGLRTFGNSWLAKAYDNRLHFKWNQTAGDSDAGKRFGARTGRLSSTPNCQNMPGDRPTHKLEDYFPQLPHPREYILPEKGQVLIGRDYCQQELRILAWYLGGPLADAYIRNQALDLHRHAQLQLLENYGIDLARKAFKTMAFGILYGMGVPKISKSLGLEKEEGRRIINAYKALLFGLSDFQRRLKEDQGVMTWGGRWYDVEPPKMDIISVFNSTTGVYEPEEVVAQSYGYKLLNYGIQGSAAEATKQATINVHQAIKESTFYLTVHDEFLLSCPKGAVKEEMQRIEEAMMDVDFSPIEMLSDGKISARNWANMRAYR